MEKEEYRHKLYQILQNLVYFGEQLKPIVRKANEVEQLYGQYHDNLNKTIGGPIKFAEIMTQFNEKKIKRNRKYS